jgi:hypothetical protein
MNQIWLLKVAGRASAPEPADSFPASLKIWQFWNKAPNVCERMEHRGGSPPAIGTQRARFCRGAFVALGQSGRQPALCYDAQGEITNTGVIPSIASADDGSSTQQGRDEVLGLGLKLVSISGTKGKKLIDAQHWKSHTDRRARA